MAQRVQSVERAAAILKLLAAEGRPVSLGQVSAALSLAKPTAHGLVQTLREVGFVDQDPLTGEYAVSADLLDLAGAPIDLNEVRSLALNWVDALAAHSGHEALVAVHQDGAATVAHHVFSPTGVTRTVLTGSALPLHASAHGKVLLAHDLSAVRRFARGVDADGGLDRLTHRTVTDQTSLAHDLAEVRDRGWALEIEESVPGLAGVAAPVRGRNGAVVAAVGVRGPAELLLDVRRQPDDALVQHVLRCARAVSRELGHGRGP